MICPACQNVIPARDRYCAYCGCRLPSPAAEPLTLGRAGGCAAPYELTDDAGTPPEGGELASYTDVGIQLNATTTSDRDIDGDGNPDSPGDGICP